MKNKSTGSATPVKQQRNRKKKGDVKLEDIARLSGVSPATVSRTLNQPHQVAKHTRERINETINSLNWVPHAGARALASHRTKLVGIIVATLGNPNISTGIQAIEGRLIKSGYNSMIICDDLNPHKQISHARMLLERGADALILHGEGQDTAVWDFLRPQDATVVVNHTFAEVLGYQTVGYDAYSEFYNLTNHLLDLGHKYFGLMMLTSPELARLGDRTPFPRMATKHRGVMNALNVRNATLQDEHITNTFFSINNGRECFRKIMSTNKPPTAIICMNDPMAIGAIIEAKYMGIDVPGDVSIVGCDDNELAAMIEPGLTTIRPPDQAMGIKAAECVLDGIRYKQQQTIHHQLEANLIIRGSTAPPR